MTMKMDCSKKGPPRILVKPPLLPKPTHISPISPRFQLIKKQSKVIKSTNTVESNECHSPSVSREFFEATTIRNSITFSDFENIGSNKLLTSKSSNYERSTISFSSLDSSIKEVEANQITDITNKSFLYTVPNNTAINSCKVNENEAEGSSFLDLTPDRGYDVGNETSFQEMAHHSSPSSFLYSEFSYSDSNDNSLQSTSENLSESSSELTTNVNEKPGEPLSEDTKANHIAKELMTSERVYIDALKLIVIDFKKFLDEYSHKTNSVVIPTGEIEKIFNTLPQILSLNDDLLNDLENRIENWHERKRIADVIVRKGPFLKLYTTYMKDFESQCNYMDECCIKYPKFSKALKEFESLPMCKKLTLKHYMLKPVQRIPHYQLLLEDYRKHVGNETREFQDTEVALSIVKDVLHHANSSLKLADNFCKMLQIQASLGSHEIIKPGRLFIKEGEIKKLSRKETQPRFIILLSDCLLYTIYTTTGLKNKYELPLYGMKVYTQPGDGTEFSIITSTRSFTLKAKSDVECTNWVTALKTAIDDNNSRQLTFLNKKCNLNNAHLDSLKLGREAPVWVQDKRTTMCQICTAEFTVTFRRHHCRSCGKVVCGDCSNNKAPLQYLKFQTARVCEKCYTYLVKEFEDPENKMIDVVKNELGLSKPEILITFENLKAAFKKMDSVKKTKKYIPQRLKEVMANDRGSSMSGWLCRKKGKEWKRMWFVLKDQVLYVYKASHDVVAYDSLPVLGYVVNRQFEEEGMDSSTVFRLTHAGQTPVVFSALSKQAADMWVAALNEACILK